MELKVIQAGNSIAVLLPKEVAARLNVKKGDSLWMTGESDTGISLTPYDPDFAAQMEAARLIMKKRRNVLHELAK